MILPKYNNKSIVVFSDDITVDLTKATYYQEGVSPKILNFPQYTPCFVEKSTYNEKEKTYLYTLVPLSSLCVLRLTIQENLIGETVGSFSSLNENTLKSHWDMSGILPN